MALHCEHQVAVLLRTMIPLYISALRSAVLESSVEIYGDLDGEDMKSRVFIYVIEMVRAWFR